MQIRYDMAYEETKSSISLVQVLQTKSLQNSKILAGSGRLDRIVTGVTVGEVPDIANWLTGGELVLSTFYAVSDDPEELSAFAKKIITGPAAALAIKPARFLKSLPAEVLELAEELNFPVIEVPADVRWTTLTAEVYTAMSRANAKSPDAENELLQAAIDGRGVRSIAYTTSKKLDAPVVIYDFLDGVVAEATPTEPFPKELVPLLRPEARPGEAESLTSSSRKPLIEHFKVSEFDVFAANVMIGSEIVAVVATAVPDTLDEASISFLKKAAEASAVEIARTRAIEEAEARIYGDFLNDLIAGRMPIEQIDSRLQKLGADLAKGYAVLYCSFELEQVFGRFYREVSRVIKTEAKGSLLMEHEGGLVVILAQTSEMAKISQASFTRQVVKKILTVADELGAKATVGISRLRADTTEIIKTLDEAKVAFDTGIRLTGAGSVTDFDEVGIYRILLPLTREAREDGVQYYQETIGMLAEYDQRHGTDLIETLESFRRNNENIALTAEELFTHRHTIRYRLQRIAEIAGCDPFKGTEREKLYMGLYVKHLLNL